MKERHNLKHIGLILDYLEGEKQNAISRGKAQKLLETCKECKSLREFHLKTENMFSTEKFKEELLNAMKKKSSNLYDEYIQFLALTEKGIEFIWEREKVDSKLDEYALAAAGTISIDANAKRTILKRLGIIKK